jgi:hypothetical protein
VILSCGVNGADSDKQSNVEGGSMVIRLSRNKWLAITFTCKNKNYEHLFGPFWLLDVAA